MSLTNPHGLKRVSPRRDSSKIEKRVCEHGTEILIDKLKLGRKLVFGTLGKPPKGHLVAQTSFLVYFHISCKKKNATFFKNNNVVFEHALCVHRGGLGSQASLTNPSEGFGAQGVTLRPSRPL